MALKSLGSRSAGPQVSLNSRTRIELRDSGLYSRPGAQQVINAIESRRVVYTLSLSHNELGDEGCVALFDFLTSIKGKKYPISEIQLGSNKIGNTGLLAIANYLHNNQHLTTLTLTNNAFTGDEAITGVFVAAINSSRLAILHLASNITLSDSFVTFFLPSLNSRYLRELDIRAMGLTSASVSHIADFLPSDRCYLYGFFCDANSFGISALRVIYLALTSRRNYRLTSFSALAVANSADGGEMDAQTQLESKRIMSDMRIMVGFNKLLNDKTHGDALRLLRYARPALLHSTEQKDQLSPNAARCDEYCSRFPDLVSPGSMPPLSSSESTPALHRLPVELKEHILSFLSPRLSAAQRIRIFQYAASASTLPQLLPCLPSLTSNHSVCIPDPSILEIGDQNKIWKIGGGGLGSGGGCATGKCLGSSNALLCHKERDREEWLFQIGCDAYEPDG